MSAITENIEHLRNLRAEAKKIPTPGMLRLVADDLYAGRPLQTTTARAEFADWTAVEVVNAAEELGKFRARSNKGKERSGNQLAADLELLTFGMSRDDIIRLAAAAQRYREAVAEGKGSSWKPRVGEPGKQLVQLWSDNAGDEFVGDMPDVVIPHGWEPAALGRNIRASLSAVVNTRTTDEEIDRYWNRTFAERQREFTAEHVFLVWWLAKYDLGAQLNKLNASSDYLNPLLVEGHDLLEVAMAETREKLEELTSSPAPNLGRMLELIEDCQWLDDGLFGRLRAIVDAAHAAGTHSIEGTEDRLGRIVVSRLDVIRRWMPTGTRTLSDIAYLSEGHLHKLCRRAGMDVDSAEEKKARDDIRSRLTTLGLSADLDQELPAGLAAWRSGQLEEYWAAVEARVGIDTFA